MPIAKQEEIFVLREGDDVVIKREIFGLWTNVPHRVKRHSPTGFEIGYLGSGPADFALNILLQFTSEVLADELYQKFKEEYISKIQLKVGQSDIISAESIKNFIKRSVES